MTSTRKAASNKLNASLSTGPRTLEGKMRSSRNAFRHGLATSLINDANVAASIDRLTRTLAAQSNDHGHVEKAQVVAEAQFDLARNRAARSEVLARIEGLESGANSDMSCAVNALEKIGRYERRTRSKLRKGLIDLLGLETDKLRLIGTIWQNEPIHVALAPQVVLAESLTTDEPRSTLTTAPRPPLESIAVVKCGPWRISPASERKCLSRKLPKTQAPVPRGTYARYSAIACPICNCLLALGLE
jgi:hypothetical protein